MRTDSFDGARAIITGGLGFIGSNLAFRLAAEGADVLLIDSLVPEYGGNTFNISGIEGRVTVNVSDVREVHGFRHLIQGADVLFNLAGQTSHLDSMTDPLTDLEINAASQLHILEACRTLNPDVTVVFASTRQIYGRPHYLPVDEHHPTRPVDVNGVNKLAGETYHVLYHDVHGLATVCLRLTNTYGPRMRIKDARQTFLGIWIKQALAGEAFEVWGGEQLRDLTYVDDAVDALLRVARSPATFGRVLNLGGPPPVTLAQLAALTVEVAGSGSFVTLPFPAPRKNIDIGSFYADFSQLRDLTGWEPRTTLRDGLTATLAYFRRHLEHYR